MAAYGVVVLLHASHVAEVRAGAPPRRRGAHAEADVLLRLEREVQPDLLVDLNEQNDPTPGDVLYLAIGTETDVVTQPVSRSAIPGAEHVEIEPQRVQGAR